jgi:hypothetical protein
MIKIEFEAATGADLRKEMLDLLGIGAINEPRKEQFINQEIFDQIASQKEEASTPEEAPKTEPTTRTRRSKAQIAAEEAALAANTGSEEPPASTENVAVEDSSASTENVEETPAVEETKVTAEDLTNKAVELGRNGKRDEVFAVLAEKFGGATIAKKDGKPQLTPEQYPAVMEAFNAIR